MGTEADLTRELSLRLGWMMGGSKLKPPGGGSWALGAGYRFNSGLRLDCASFVIPNVTGAIADSYAACQLLIVVNKQKNES